jgi:two-component system CheB/CheR fusion protein
LFEPFQQAASGARDGLGLGLAIARGIVELHGGRLTASSAGLDRGARFIVDLPTLAVNAALAVPETETMAGGPPPRGPKRMTRILLVEDHRDTAQMLAECLTEAGYVVDTAAAVPAALKADLSSVSLVISDINLPGGGGLALIRKLREKHPIKAIALSGYGTERDVTASLEAGFTAHLIKPIAMSALVAAIEKALR